MREGALYSLQGAWIGGDGGGMGFRAEARVAFVRRREASLFLGLESGKTSPSSSSFIDGRGERALS